MKKKMPLLGGIAIVLLIVVFIPLLYWFFAHGTSRPEADVPEVVVVDRNIYGYHISQGEVVFEFDPRDYGTARMSDGSLGNIASVLDIDQVAVAGPFNGWGKDDPDWQLVRSGRNRFTLKKNLKHFQERAFWPFKFVVNGSIWVSAPEKARNKVVVAEDTSTYNLMLENPDNTTDEEGIVLQAYRRSINGVWPGQGMYLAVNKEGDYRFTFSHYTGARAINNLDVLANIPLSALNLSDVQPMSDAALGRMHHLTELLCNDEFYWSYASAVIPPMIGGDFETALAAAENIFKGYEQTPACVTFSALMVNSVKAMAELSVNAGAIPASTMNFQGARYVPIMQPMLWDDARSYAEQHGAHLLAVGSEEEQVWVTKNIALASMGRRFWLGGTDRAVEGQWTWVNAERWRFDHWSYPEPNNFGGAENVLAMSGDGWWFDANSDSLQLPFVMEWND